MSYLLSRNLLLIFQNITLRSDELFDSMKYCLYLKRSTYHKLCRAIFKPFFISISKSVCLRFIKGRIKKLTDEAPPTGANETPFHKVNLQDYILTSSDYLQSHGADQTVKSK